MRCRDVGDPVAHRLVDGVFESLASRFDRDDGGPEQLHTRDVQRLPLGVFLPHVDDTFQSHQCRGCRRRDSVLPGTRLGDDSRLTHAGSQQRLSENVVDLVRSRVVEVFSFEVDAGPTALAFKASRSSQRRGSSGVVLLQVRKLPGEVRIGARCVEGLFQLIEGTHQRFWNETTSIRAEMTRC